MKELFLIATVALLLASGLSIALRSGGVGVRIFAGNASGLVLRVVGYLVVLLIVQRAVGLPSPLRW